MRKIILALMLAFISTTNIMAQEQLKRVYDENIDRTEQINNAVSNAKNEGKFVLAQVGGNWCPWCLRFADLAAKDTDINKVIDDNFVYIHVNYPRKMKDEQTIAIMKRLGNPQRFGFPVFVILTQEGDILHIQDSSYLEDDKGYSKDKVITFLNHWTPSAVK